MNIYSGIEELVSETGVGKVNLLTGFRPSAPSRDDKSTSLTLGHLTQIEGIKRIQNFCKEKGLSFQLFIILADHQGYLDHSSPQHFKNIQKYTENYALEIAACFPKTDQINIFRESKVYEGTILPLSHVLQANLPYDYLVNFNKLERTSSRLNETFGKEMTFARMVSESFDQAAHGMGANANIVPAGPDQMAPFDLYNRAIENIAQIKERSFIEKIHGITHSGFLLGTDGQKMSTSRGNGVPINVSTSDLKKKITTGEISFSESIIKHFSPCLEMPNTDEAKRNIAFTVIAKMLEPIQDRMNDYINKEYELEERLQSGEDAYRLSANNVLTSLNSEGKMIDI